MFVGCNRDFKNRTRLHDHIRTHTKEKTVACPSCYHLFATKTRFFDHRKRQLSVDCKYLKKKIVTYFRFLKS